MASPLPHPDEVAEAAAACQAAFASVQEHGWARRVGGAFATVSGVSSADANSAWGVVADVAPRDLAEALEAVAATGLPHGLQVRPTATALGAALAGSAGLAPAHDVPVMALTADRLRAGTAERLVIERAEDPADLHAVVAAAFRVSIEEVVPLLPDAVFGLPGVQALVGRVEGVAVTGGISLRTAEAVGLFDIATLPTRQGSGYGRALVTALLQDAFAAGARWAWLRSEPDGRRLYERLGFETLERWPTWFSVAGLGDPSPGCP